LTARRSGSEFPKILITSTKKLPGNSYKLIANAKLKSELKQGRIMD
jgi:hypothetical protein